MTRLASRLSRVAPSAIGSALRLGDRTDLISLAGGLPAAEGFPLHDVRAATDKVLSQDPVVLQYGDTNGLPELREWIAAGSGAGPDDVIITHGAQQGIDLVCKALLDPGDVVVVDRPSYLGALQVFRLYEAELRAVPLADDPDLAELEAALTAGLRPRLLYAVSSFANPSGATLSAHQRRRLAVLADEYDFMIIDDDPYADIWLTPAAPDTAPIPGDRVVRLGSFSKTLFPGCRVGHLIAPSPLIPALRTVRQASDLGNSDLLQRIALELVERTDDLEARLTTVRALYRQRRDALAAALTAHLPGDARFALPDGGFFLWAELSDVDTSALLPVAVRHGVSFVPGAPFFVRDEVSSAVRLAFSCLPADRADEAGTRLAAAVREVRS